MSKRIWTNKSRKNHKRNKINSFRGTIKSIFSLSSFAPKNSIFY